MADNNSQTEEETRITWTEWLVKYKDFMNTYPRDRETIEGPEWDALLEIKPNVWEYRLQSPMTMEGLDELKEVLNWGDEDPEAAHSMESEVASWFAEEVASDRWTREEIRELAKKIKEIAAIPFRRWFA